MDQFLAGLHCSQVGSSLKSPKLSFKPILDVGYREQINSTNQYEELQRLVHDHTLKNYNHTDAL
jgi:hypothetical protein